MKTYVLKIDSCQWDESKSTVKYRKKYVYKMNTFREWSVHFIDIRMFYHYEKSEK